MRRLRAVSLLLLALAVLYVILGPVVVRLPLVEWTYQDGHAIAGLTVWPLFVAVDTGPQGPATLAHELCHWRHPFWPEWACDALDSDEEGR